MLVRGFAESSESRAVRFFRKALGPLQPVQEHRFTRRFKAQALQRFLRVERFPGIHGAFSRFLVAEKAKNVPVLFLERIVMNPDPRLINSSVFRFGVGNCPRNDIISLWVIPESRKHGAFRNRGASLFRR